MQKNTQEISKYAAKLQIQERRKTESKNSNEYEGNKPSKPFASMQATEKA